MPFESNRNEILSKNRSKNNMQYLKLCLWPDKFLWGPIVIPPGENTPYMCFAMFFLFLIWNVIIKWEVRYDSIWWNLLFKLSLTKLVEPWVNK